MNRRDFVRTLVVGAAVAAGAGAGLLAADRRNLKLVLGSGEPSATVSVWMPNSGYEVGDCVALSGFSDKDDLNGVYKLEGDGVFRRVNPRI